MEKYAAQGLISGMTPSLKSKTPAEVAEFTNRFQRLSKYPLLFGWSGISYSGGTDVRLGQAMRLGATRSKELCYQAAKIEAEEARALGFHFTATPNVDVNTNPDNPIINLRSLSDDPALVTELAAELCGRDRRRRGAVVDALSRPWGHGQRLTHRHPRSPTQPRRIGGRRFETFRGVDSPRAGSCHLHQPLPLPGAGAGPPSSGDRLAQDCDRVAPREAGL